MGGATDFKVGDKKILTAKKNKKGDIILQYIARMHGRRHGF